MDMVFWSVALLLIALALIFLEIFVPSGGLISCLVAAAVIASLVVAFFESPTFGATMVVITTIALPAVIGMAIKWWPHTPIGRLILLPRPSDPDDLLPENEEFRGLDSLIGRHGVARCDMMPSGTVRIDHRNYDAVSDGVPIDAGQSVEVVDVRTHRIIVRPVDREVPPSVDESASDVLSQPIDSLGLDDPLA